MIESGVLWTIGWIAGTAMILYLILKKEKLKCSKCGHLAGESEIYKYEEYGRFTCKNCGTHHHDDWA